MRNTRYQTFILRLRLDDVPSKEPAGEYIFGSVQQVGQSEIFHFSSTAKFLETMHSLVERFYLSEVTGGDTD